MAIQDMTGNQIRSAFLDYFQRHGHAAVKSSPLVPKADPTLLFTNAGMVQFKDVFTGKEARPYVRAVTAQKCVRAGGKHNDLENVGRTARHHTFFEMLGNFSFGDYFKAQAIEHAWTFLTGTLSLCPDRLWVTIHEGDPALGVSQDEEAARLWLRYVRQERIVPCTTKDNFWQMGDTGPCGPCSEIIYDQGPALGCGKPGCAVGCDCDRYLELWNLVFMQFERSADGVLTPLPRPSIDTGAGLERLAGVLQGVRSNFDTDLFRPIIGAVEALCGKGYGADSAADVSMRVIADHARATAFLVADGVLPSNEGRGYVLRRILRRALRHGRMLGLEQPFMATVTSRVAEEMQAAYPELQESRDYVARVVQAEEERFGHTLHVGLKMVDAMLEAQKAAGARCVPGQEIFKLYDTYGFPLDLLRDIAADQGFALDEAGFEQAMEEQRSKARESWVGSGEVEIAPGLKALAERFRVEPRWYDSLAEEARITEILAGEDPVPVAALHAGETGELVLDRTPFYPEAGGQIADTGRIVAEDGALAEVLKVHRPTPTLVLHTVRVKRGSFTPGATVRAEVDAERRAVTAKNHTATHLLHAALRQVLGDHVKQAGSLVAPDRLRFDFSHFSPLTPQEVDRIESIVNARIWENRPVTTVVADLDEAVKGGAMALFGEKYGERVRVVTVEAFSQELCGGTHVKATGELGLFRIVGQGGVAAGVRRLEAVTGPGAYRLVKRDEGILGEAAALIKARPPELLQKVERLVEINRELERERERLQGRLAGGILERLLATAQEVGGIRVVSGRVESLDAKSMRELGDRVRARLGSGVVVLVAEAEARVLWVTMATKDLSGRLHAGHLARDLAVLTGGGGGGRPDMAEAGGKDPARIDEALGQLPAMVARQLEGK